MTPAAVAARVRAMCCVSLLTRQRSASAGLMPFAPPLVTGKDTLRSRMAAALSPLVEVVVAAVVEAGVAATLERRPW